MIPDAEREHIPRPHEQPGLHHRGNDTTGGAAAQRRMNLDGSCHLREIGLGKWRYELFVTCWEPVP